MSTANTTRIKAWALLEVLLLLRSKREAIENLSVAFSSLLKYMTTVLRSSLLFNSGLD